MPSASSNTIANTMAWAAMLNFGRNASPTGNQEPALTSANTILQTIVNAPFAWRWNRQTIGFITTPGQQDYTIFNWTASFTVKVGWLTIDSNGNCQKATNVTGPTGTSAPAFAGTVGGTVLDGGVTWTNMGSVGVPLGTSYKFGWIETSSVYDASATTPIWKEMESQLCIGLGTEQSRPRFIAAQGDDGNGNITFRLNPAPDQAYPIAVTMQQKASLFTSTSQTWAPIPDEFSHIYNWGFLSLMWLFADDPRFGTANQKFVSQILGTSEGLTETERNIFLQNWEAITGQPLSNQMAKSQGFQARGI